MRRQSFDRAEKTLAIFLVILFTVTLATASVSESLSTNVTSSVKNEKDCREYNQGHHNGYLKGYNDGFINGINCKKARIFSMIYYVPVLLDTMVGILMDTEPDTVMDMLMEKNCAISQSHIRCTV